MTGLPRVGLFVGEWGSQNMVELLVRSCSVFNSLQSIQDSLPSSSRNDQLSLGASAQEVEYYSRFTTLYRKALLNFIKNAPEPPSPSTQKESSSNPEESSSSSDGLPPKLQAQQLHTILHLAQTIWIPADGRGLGVVGEELLDWLNVCDSESLKEQEEIVMSSPTPYESPNFADYILSCVLRGYHPAAASMMETLSSAPYPSLAKMSDQIAKSLHSFPRSSSFTHETEFLSSRRKWNSQVRSLENGLEADFNQLEIELEEIGGLSAEEASDSRISWEAEFRVLVRAMNGSQQDLLSVSTHWKEALGAWGVLVSPSLKRDDIPQVAQLIFEHFGKMNPRFESGLSAAEQMMRALVLGKADESIKLSQSVDPWLSCHLTDLFSRMGLLEDSEQQDSEMMGVEGEEEEPREFNPLDSDARFKAIEDYAVYLLEDQGLWRIALDYLSQNQLDQGLSRRRIGSESDPKSTRARRAMRAVIMKVPVLGSTKGKARQLDDSRVGRGQGGDEDEGMQGVKAQSQRDEFETADELIEACDTFGLQKEKRLICKKLARELSAQSRYSPSLIFAILASDLNLIQQISDVILDTYINQGAKAFMSLVDSLPQALLSPHPPREEVEGTELDFEMEEDGMSSEEEEEEEEAVERNELIKSRRKTGSQKREEVAIRSAFQKGLNMRLLFLGFYRDFLRNYQEGNLKDSARLIIELLQSLVAPERFWAVLLVDSVPLLRSLDPPYFTSQETFELMRFVELVTSSSRIHPKHASYWLSSLEKVLSRISRSPPSSSSRRGRNFDGNRDGGQEEEGEAEDEEMEFGLENENQIEVEMEMELEKELTRGSGNDASSRNAAKAEINHYSILKRLDIVRLFAARHLAKEGAGVDGYY